MVALLEDRQAGRLLVLAATHLKAKSGEENEQQRLRQVRCRSLLRPAGTGCGMTQKLSKAAAIKAGSHRLGFIDLVGSCR